MADSCRGSLHRIMFGSAWATCGFENIIILLSRCSQFAGVVSHCLIFFIDLHAHNYCKAFILPVFDAYTEQAFLSIVSLTSGRIRMCAASC